MGGEGRDYFLPGEMGNAVCQQSCDAEGKEDRDHDRDAAGIGHGSLMTLVRFGPGLIDVAKPPRHSDKYRRRHRPEEEGNGQQAQGENAHG